MDQLIRTQTKGIEPKDHDKVHIKIPTKHGIFWEKEYNQDDLIENVISDFKRENSEEIPEEYISDWKNDNETLNMKTKIRAILTHEIPTLIIDSEHKKNYVNLGKKSIPELVGKPFYDPFEVFIFKKKDKTLKIQKYDNDTIEEKNLDDYGASSAYCNGNNYLFISGGEKKDSEILLDKFWKINLENQEINIINMPSQKKNHSMVYISLPRESVYIVGGNDLKTFYYDIENDRIKELHNLNYQRTEPALILISNYLYCIDNVNSKDKSESFSLERIDITSQNPSWEIITPILPNKFNQKFFGVVESKNNEIIFLGGNMDENENEYNFKYNINSNKIEDTSIPFQEYNFKEKLFLPYKENIDYILPDFNRYHPEVIFFQKNKNKLSSVKYELSKRNEPKISKQLKYYNFNQPSDKDIEGQNSPLINNKDNINIPEKKSDKEGESLEIDDILNINKNINEQNTFQNPNLIINIDVPKSTIEQKIDNQKEFLNQEKGKEEPINLSSKINLEIQNPEVNTGKIIYPDIRGEFNIEDNHSDIKYTNNPDINKENDFKSKPPELAAKITSPQTNVNLDIDMNNLNPTINMPNLKTSNLNFNGPEIISNSKPSDLIKSDNDKSIDIKGKKIDIKDSNNILNGKVNVELPGGIEIKKPELNINPHEDFFLDGIIVGTKKIKENTSGKVKINEPKINTQELKINGNAPDIDIKASGQKISLKSDFNLCGIIKGTKEKEIKGSNSKANANLNIKNPINTNHKYTSNYMSGIIEGINNSKINFPDVNKNGPNIKSSNINLKGNAPGININGPNMNIPFREADINLDKKININENVPNINLDLPKIDGNNNGFDLNGNINAPKVNIKSDINVPDIDINAPKIDIPTTQIKSQNAEFATGDIKIQGSNINKEIDFNKNISGGIELNPPNINGKIDNKDNREIKGTIPGLKIKGSQLEGIKSSLKTNVKNTSDFYISGIIEGINNDPKNMKSSAINIPGLEINGPKMELNGKMTGTNINGPNIDINGPSTNLNLKGSSTELYGNVQGVNIKEPKLNIPSNNIEQKDINIGGNFNVKGKDLNMEGEIPGIKVDPKINIKGQSISSSKADFFLSGIIPPMNNKKSKIISDSNMQSAQISVKGPNFENYSKNLNFHGSSNDRNNFENDLEIKGSRKLLIDENENNINIETPKIKINGNTNLIAPQNLEIGGSQMEGSINLINNNPRKLEIKKDNEDKKFGINVNLDSGFKKEDINLGNLGQEFISSSNKETKIVLNSGIFGIYKKGKGLPIVGSKNSNFEPSKIDAAGKLEIENLNVDNLKSANVGVNGQKMGERIIE